MDITFAIKGRPKKKSESIMQSAAGTTARGALSAFSVSFSCRASSNTAGVVRKRMYIDAMRRNGGGDACGFGAGKRARGPLVHSRWMSSFAADGGSSSRDGESELESSEVDPEEVLKREFRVDIERMVKLSEGVAAAHLSDADISSHDTGLVKISSVDVENYGKALENKENKRKVKERLGKALEGHFDDVDDPTAFNFAENESQAQWLVYYCFYKLMAVTPYVDYNMEPKDLSLLFSSIQFGNHASAVVSESDQKVIDTCARIMLPLLNDWAHDAVGARVFQMALFFASPHLRQRIVDTVIENFDEWVTGKFSGHLVRNSMVTASEEERAELVDAVIETAEYICYDVVGSHSVQCALSLVSCKDQRNELINMAIDHVAVWGRNKYAAYAVQKAIMVSSEDQVRRFADAVTPRLDSLAENQHFHFVLQKLITCMPAESYGEFVRQLFRTSSMIEKVGHTTSGIVTITRVYERLDETSARMLCAALAPHVHLWMPKEFGSNFLCNTLKLMKDDPAAAEPLVERIVELAEEMGNHPYATQVVADALLVARSPAREDLVNTVVENFMEWKDGRSVFLVLKAVPFMSEEQMNKCAKDVLPHAKRMSMNKFGSFIVQALLSHASPTYREALVRELQDSIVSDLSGDHHGNYVAQACIEKGSYNQVRHIVDDILPLVEDWAMCPIRNHVVQRALEYGEPDQQINLIDRLIPVFPRVLASTGNRRTKQANKTMTVLALHMKKCMLHGSETQKNHIIDIVCNHLETLVESYNCTSLVLKCLRDSNEDQRMRFMIRASPHVNRWQHSRPSKLIAELLLKYTEEMELVNTVDIF